MNTLYARRNPVFEPIVSGGSVIDQNTGCILDMRLHWTSDTIVNPSPQLTTLLENSNGASIVTDFSYSSGISGASCIMELAAKHPTADVYYSARIERTDTELLYEPYIVREDRIYTYNVNSEAYCVLAASLSGVNIHQPLSWSGGYILMDLNINTPTISGAHVEPFNVIFDPVISGGEYPTSITWGASGAQTLSGTTFTNNPILSSGATISGAVITSTSRPVPACNFTLMGNTVRLDRNYSTINPSTTGIRAINNVVPVNGNINITIS